MKNAAYRFTSHWLIETDPATASRTLDEVASWPEWWPGLEKLENLRGTPGRVGSRVRCTWRAGGYRLDIIIEITDYQPQKLLTFNSSGDLAGEGKWTIQKVGEHQTAMQIVWNVATTKAWMNRFAPILRPVFERNHEKVMKNGERGFNQFLLKHTRT